MDILKEFGVNPILLTAQIVNFLIILYIIKRFLLKPILDVLNRRKQMIKAGLEQAEESRILLEKTESREKEILKKAQEESKKIIEETRKQRDQILQEAEVISKNNAQRILDDARKQIIYETTETQKKLSIQISKLAVEFLQKSAAQIFSKADQDKIVENAVQKIKKKVD